MNFIKRSSLLLSLMGFLSSKSDDSSLVQIITFDELQKTSKTAGIQLLDVGLLMNTQTATLKRL